jgi:hypothetical protein
LKHLKEDIDDIYFDLDGVAVKGSTYYLTVEDIKEIAKHFFELGVKAQKRYTGENKTLNMKEILLKFMKWLESRGFISDDLCYDSEHQVYTFATQILPKQMDKKNGRFVIRRKESMDYYTGNQTFNTMGESFGPFETAKVFKNVAGAKNACLHLDLHLQKYGKNTEDFEIVEVITIATENITEYERKYKG